MKNKKNIAKFLLKPTIEALGGGCSDWKRKVRLFAHGLLKKDAEAKVATHIKTCTACRLFLLDCIEAQKEFTNEYMSKNPPVADKLINGQDALVVPPFSIPQGTKDYIKFEFTIDAEAQEQPARKKRDDTNK